jgi:hypothetical protein
MTAGLEDAHTSIIKCRGDRFWNRCGECCDVHKEGELLIAGI